ncbi:hypothetical protein PF008_g32841 [Phytophthora fragariae]|uniref:Uncharacterized protein n=1 Tax=Phytophthora fragariae TaxID=53985 RepID=A0A6G0PZB6_9STRA|nr:hypothetical protein PF008_g32841 [Phytophthora fragariae]
MFQYTTGNVIEALKYAVNDAEYMGNLAMCSFGNFHIDFTSKLYDMQRDESLDGERLPVSSYVSDLFVIKSGMGVIAALAHRLMGERNPSMDDFYFKWLLLVLILRRVVTLQGGKKDDDVRLPHTPIITFDPKKHFRKEEYRNLYSGVVTKCHEDDTYDIEYESGKKVTCVPCGTDKPASERGRL